MEVIHDKATMRAWSRRQRVAGRRVALVPTMGFLHDGHLSLVAEARARADVVVVSIYVNPGQFGPTEDLATYPRDLEGDLAKLQPLHVDAVFNPADMYVREATPVPAPAGGGATAGAGESREGDGAAPPPAPGAVAGRRPGGGRGHETWVTVERLQVGLCGASRPAFFRGVATVVAKLFNVVEPDVAVFGKKDYQQWRVLCRMVRDLDFDVEVVGAPLLREADGLAMSSRNVRLTPVQRRQVDCLILISVETPRGFLGGGRDRWVHFGWPLP